MRAPLSRRSGEDLLILKTVALAPVHGFGIAQRIRQVSADVLQVQQGSLHPALHRLLQSGWIRARWGTLGEELLRHLVEMDLRHG